MTKKDAEKLKRIMRERDEDNGGEPLNAVDRGYHLACEHLYEEIDKLLKEQKSCEDAISRKELVEWLENIQPTDGKELGVLFDVREHVKKVPSVTPTQKMKAEIIDDLIKEIKDAEKKFDDKGAHNISAGFYYARKELEKMRGAELPHTDKSGLDYADQPTLRSAI